MTAPTPLPSGSVEERLVAALEARADLVTPDRLEAAGPPTPDPRRPRAWYVAGAAAAAVVLVGGLVVAGLSGADDRSDDPVGPPSATGGADGPLPRLWPAEEPAGVVGEELLRFDHVFRLAPGDGGGRRIEVEIAEDAVDPDDAVDPVVVGTDVDVPPGAVPSYVGTLEADDPVVVVSVSAAPYTATTGSSERTTVFAATPDATALVELEQPAPSGDGPTLRDTTVWVVEGRLFSTTQAQWPDGGAAPAPGRVWEWVVRGDELVPVDLGEVCVGLPATRPDGGAC